jgi:hypothetical protein
MVGVWLLFILLARWGPIRYENPISVQTIDFTIACVGLFAAGAALTSGPAATAMVAGRSWNPDPGIRRLALLGIIGAALVLVDKVLLHPFDVSEGLGALRAQVQVDAETERSRSALLWIGSLLYSCSNAALVLYVLRGDACERKTGLLVFFASFSPAIVVLLYGGRSSAALTMLFIMSAGLVRLSAGERFVPRAPFLRLLVTTHLLLVAVGSIYVFASRNAAAGATDRAALLEHFLDGVEGRHSPSLDALMEPDDVTATVIANTLLSVAYVTHSFTELDYLLTQNAPVGPFWGGYQAALPTRAVRLLLGLPDSMYEHLDDPVDHAGLFMTAWGSMYLDFGFWLAPIAAGVAGLLSGLAYYTGIATGSLVGRLFLTYAFVYILLSPVHSALAWGNSLQTLICFCAAPALLSPRLDRIAWPWRKSTVSREDPN